MCVPVVIWGRRMRSEQEMYRLILEYAKQDPKIRGVVLNGSRANPAAPLDRFRDFDVVYLVTDVGPYKAGDISKEFGEVLVMQRTDESKLFHEHFPREACYLMQFKDGNRIDLTVAQKEDYRGYCFDDRLSLVLLDKDGFLPALPPPDGSTHDITRPDISLFQECRTEFWWTAPYVSKALWRGQLLLAQNILESCTRPMLRLMMAWTAGGEKGFPITPGKQGDGLAAYLPGALWERYLSTYAPCKTEEIRRVLFDACVLFTEMTEQAARLLQFPFDGVLDREVTAFMKETHPQIAAMEPDPSWDGEWRRAAAAENGPMGKGKGVST